ncbi:ABC transporter substrate-binding protein [Streptomyces sp. MSC1_001]|jgi:ABC-type branched-subunit amino acid transport system substrate-binding protein|uniref:ABC transporter substrate-binding protein n=1 Tax=Streptomyces sp. MSC1_001 TaxID=2909263 RepID=UPI00202F9E15|nr:ABC transporter substrate-binding protein [Streptomyces sp. MSC1_001]
MNRKHLRLTAALGASLVLTLTGCSTKAAPESDSGSGGSGGVKTGPGVSDTAIKVGVITDLTGPAAPLAKPSMQASQLYVDQVNAAGGVCGRKVELLVRDHGFDVQKAVAAYAEVQPQVAALGSLLGSAQTSALLDSIERDKLVTMVGGNSASSLGHEHVQVMSTTYDLDMINGVDWLVKTNGLKSGDKVGLIHQPGEYGENAAEGVRFAAKKAGLELVVQTVKPTDTDMTAQVTALGAQKVKAVVFAGTPGQTASLVGVAAAGGLKVPVLAHAAAYVPQLLATPAKPALERMLYVVGGVPALSGDAPALKQLVADYGKKYPKEQLNVGVQVGTTNSAVLVEALRAACAAKDLSREGITKGLRSLKSFDKGMGSVLDFSDPAKSPNRKSYVLRPAEGLPGGLKTVQNATEVPAVAEYLAARH